MLVKKKAHLPSVAWQEIEAKISQGTDQSERTSPVLSGQHPAPNNPNLNRKPDFETAPPPGKSRQTPQISEGLDVAGT